MQCRRGPPYKDAIAAPYRGDEQNRRLLVQILAHRFGFPVAQYRDPRRRSGQRLLTFAAVSLPKKVIIAAQDALLVFLSDRFNQR
jgi:hypothetical protein